MTYTDYKIAVIFYERKIL